MIRKIRPIRQIRFPLWVFPPWRNNSSPTGEWNKDRDWWSSNFHNRPYASADLGFQEYEPGYRFGYESVNRYRGRPWDEAEPMLRTDWKAYHGRGQSTWENVKDAVRDAWDSITGKV